MRDVDEPVQVVEYRAEWASQASAEADRITQALGLPSEDVEHIGSTAVCGLVAKPTIDLMLGVAEYPAPSLQSSIVALGYEALGEAGVPGRLYFRLRGRASFNLHLVLKGGTHWRHNLALREYLRASSGARERYSQAKLAALSSGARTLLPYSAAKAVVVAALLQEALAGNNGG